MCKMLSLHEVFNKLLPFRSQDRFPIEKYPIPVCFATFLLILVIESVLFFAMFFQLLFKGPLGSMFYGPPVLE